MLYVLLRFMDSDNPFGIFKLFLGIQWLLWNSLHQTFKNQLNMTKLITGNTQYSLKY